MSHFIEVHDGLNPILINCDNVEWIADGTITTKDSEIKVTETYDELKALVERTAYIKVPVMPVEKQKTDPAVADGYESHVTHDSQNCWVCECGQGVERWYRFCYHCGKKLIWS